MANDHEYVYVLNKEYITPSSQTTLRNPIAVSSDYETIAEYAKQKRDYILNNGASLFYENYISDGLVAWDGIYCFMVSTNDRQYRIVFTIKLVKLLTKD